MRTPKCIAEKFADSYSQIENQERFKDEVSQAIFSLMEYNDDRRVDLARKLGCSPARVSQMLAGSHNFTLEKLADIMMALGRSVHLYLDLNLETPSIAFDKVGQVDDDDSHLDWAQYCGKTSIKLNTSYDEALWAGSVPINKDFTSGGFAGEHAKTGGY